MKALIVPFALAMATLVAAPAPAQIIIGSDRTVSATTQASQAPRFRLRRQLTREERFDRAYPNSGLSRAAKIALVIREESAETGSDRRLPRLRRPLTNQTLGGVRSRAKERPQPTIRVGQARNGNYRFLRRR